MSKARDNYVLDVSTVRRGYALNRMCGSLTQPENRRRFLADEAAYCDEYGLQDLGGVFTGMSTEEFIAAMRSGGRIYG